MQCCTNNQLPRVEHVEGSSFDRTFTLLDRNGDPYVFPVGSTATFILRSRLDTLLGSFVIDILPTPGQVRFRLAASQTVGKVGRFIWSGTIDSGIAIIALEANEFHVVEGVSGDVAVDPTPTPQPQPNPGIAGDASYQQTFTQSNLSIAGLIPITYPVAIPVSGLVVYNNDGNQVNPDNWRSLSPTTIELNLTSFTPIIGTWTASISL